MLIRIVPVRLVTKYSLWKSVVLQGIGVPLGTLALEPVICVLVRGTYSNIIVHMNTYTTYIHTYICTLVLK